jgi:predicted small secreted protein
MKKIKIVLAVLVVSAAFTSCVGDHGVGSGEDTAKNSYQVTDYPTSKDTAEVITHTGETVSKDYSASGGANLVKPDSTLKK